MNWKKILAVLIGLVIFSNILKICGCVPDSGQSTRKEQKGKQEPEEAVVTTAESRTVTTPIESKEEVVAEKSPPKVILTRGWLTAALSVEMTEQVTECFEISNWKYSNSPLPHVEAKAVWVDGFSVGPRKPGMEWDGFDGEGTKIDSGIVHASGEFRKNEPTRIEVTLSPDVAKQIVRVQLCFPR